MQLFSTPASPFARKVRVLIREAGLDANVEIVDVTVTPVSPNTDVVRHSPVAKVPTLVTDKGEAILDSRVICEFLDSQHSGEKMFPADGAARWRVLTDQALGDAIMDAGVLMRYEQVSRPEALFWPDWQQAQADRAMRIVGSLEDRVADLSGRVDIGTITIGCALSYLDFRFPGFLDWRADHTGMAAWYKKFADRPSMTETVLVDPNEAAR